MLGYDKQVAEKLKLRYEQEGNAALTEAQWLALHAVLNCEPFWQGKVELLNVYGLPAIKDQLEQFLEK
jgi:hypothetical protein